MSNAVLSATEITVATANQHSTILVGEGLGEHIAALLDRQSVGRKRFVVSSPVIWRHQGARIQQAIPVEPILLPVPEVLPEPVTPPVPEPVPAPKAPVGGVAVR